MLCVLNIYSASIDTKKGQSFVTRDLTLFPPEAFFLPEELRPGDLEGLSLLRLPLQVATYLFLL